MERIKGIYLLNIEVECVFRTTAQLLVTKIERELDLKGKTHEQSRKTYVKIQESNKYVLTWMNDEKVKMQKITGKLVWKENRNY